MNFVDLVIILLIIFFALEGLGRNFFSEILDLASFILALILSLRFYNLAGKFFENNFSIPHSLANVIGFVAIWFIVETSLILILGAILNKLKLPHLFRVVNFLGVIPATAKGIIFVGIILVLIATFPIQPKIKIAVDKSKLGSLILSYTQSLERPLKGVFGGITEDTLTFLTIKPQTDERVNLGFRILEFRPNPTIEDQMIELVNKERASQGLKNIEFNDKLREVARLHSADMFERGYFSHFSPEGENVANRAEEFGIDYLVIGENLAYGPNLNLAHNGLMNSEGHRANILSPDFGKIGIGIQDGGVYGLMIAQVFSN